MERTSISNEAQSFLKIPEEVADKLTNRLDAFISKFRINFVNHATEFHRNPSGEIKRWDSSLGLVSADQVLDKGVGKTFLVIWNSSGIDINQDGRWVDVEIWAAKGLRVDNNSGNLIVSYYSIGYLEAGSWKFIGKPLNPFRKQDEDSIFSFSKVVLE